MMIFNKKNLKNPENSIITIKVEIISNNLYIEKSVLDAKNR